MAFYQLVSELLTQNHHTAEDWDEAYLTGVLEFATPLIKSHSQIKIDQTKIDSSPPVLKSKHSDHPSFDASPSAGEPALKQNRLDSPSIEFKQENEGDSEKTRRILLAEDNAIMQKLALQQLSKLGLLVTAVANGREVLDALENHDYLLVLMDCQMPVLDGFETTRIIRGQEKATGKHIPVIALTASAMQGDEDICYAAGMDDYLCKPVNRQQLRLMINKWCPQEDFSFLEEHQLAGAGEGAAEIDATEIKAAAETDATGSLREEVKKGPLTEESRNGGKAIGETAVSETALAEKSVAEKSILTKVGITSSVETFNLPELISLYGKSSIPELFLSFIEEGTSILASTRKALEEKDVQELKMQAHTFKGMAAVLTAVNLAQISLRIEDSAKRADFETAKQHFNDLKAAFNKAEKTIEKILEEKDQFT
jgi:CheY-like chemotaxis protein